MYRPFNLDHLKQVRQVVLETDQQTIWISTNIGGSSAADLINLGDGHDDDKDGPFNIANTGLVVRLLEQITGYKFQQKTYEHSVIWERTDVPVSKR